MKENQLAKETAMLYILLCQDEVKIGISQNQKSLSRRLSNLQTGRGRNIEIYALYYGYGYYVEQAILRQFDSYRPLLTNPLNNKAKTKKSEWLIGADLTAILQYIADNDSAWRNVGWASAVEEI